MIETVFTVDLDKDGVADPHEPTLDLGLMPEAQVGDWVQTRDGRLWRVIGRTLVERPQRDWEQRLLVQRDR